LTTIFSPVDLALVGLGLSHVDVEAVRTDLCRRRQWLVDLGHSNFDEIRSVRCFPVLAVLAPVMTERGGEVAYPGDPMCLYAALSVTVRNAIESVQSGLIEGTAYNDLVPDWGTYPNREVRRHAVSSDGGAGFDTPNKCLFDPRVWDSQSKMHLIAKLQQTRPRAVLISTVSAGFRYAIEIASVVRHHAPDALIVLGGRHVDETIKYDAAAGVVRAAYSSPIAGIRDRRVPPVFDFVISGQGAHALDALLRAIALALATPTGRPDVKMVCQRLAELAACGLRVPGSGVLAAVTATGEVVSLPFNAERASMRDHPSPYQAFPIRARFSIFTRPRQPSQICLTGHMMTVDTCPFKCTFCSEGHAGDKTVMRFEVDEVGLVVERLCELVHYGAEAIFFDDPVFFAANLAAILEFCSRLRQLRESVAKGTVPEPMRPWIATREDELRLLDLQWGAQFTVDMLAKGTDSIRSTLASAATAGCTYVYIGIESMADEIMSGVHKNLRVRRNTPWATRVRRALEEVRDVGIRAGSSVLFGLDGETRVTIRQTIEEIGLIIDDGLLALASPNILTYHPGTAIAREHLGEIMDYHSPLPNRPPYTFFEEAYPGLISQALDEEAVWLIHREADRRWAGRRNRDNVLPSSLSGTR
jgi:radical SAM superfamily enzyme YgiQ (UPF0313 family)